MIRLFNPSSSSFLEPTGVPVSPPWDQNMHRLHDLFSGI
jgi:hypothetical protein